MDVQILKKFLVVAQTQNISKAADILHISQPPLSRQLQDLEKELGVTLLVRGNKNTTLTAEGLLLQKRAQEILELVQKTQTEIEDAKQNIKGTVYIGAGESVAFSIIANVAKNLQKSNSAICFSITSGDGEYLKQRLEQGLIDFALFIGEWDIEQYDYIKLPLCDRWGVVMPKTHPLSKKDYVTAKDLENEPLVISKQSLVMGTLDKFFSKSIKDLKIVATYNLAYNAGCFVRQGVGIAMTLDKLLPTDVTSNLCFLPLSPPLYANLRLAWKKNQVFSRSAKCFLDTLLQTLKE